MSKNYYNVLNNDYDEPSPSTNYINSDDDITIVHSNCKSKQKVEIVEITGNLNLTLDEPADDKALADSGTTDHF